MDPRKKRETEKSDEKAPEDLPVLEEQDWEGVGSTETAPDSIPQNGDLRYDVEQDAEAPGEDDDNPYQNSDEALPGDREEAAIERDPSKEGGRFDGI